MQIRYAHYAISKFTSLTRSSKIHNAIKMVSMYLDKPLAYKSLLKEAQEKLLGVIAISFETRHLLNATDYLIDGILLTQDELTNYGYPDRVCYESVDELDDMLIRAGYANLERIAFIKDMRRYYKELRDFDKISERYLLG